MRVLLVRAGALGDLLLLRRALSALRAAGHEPWLVAPEAGRVLVGGGPGEAAELVSWDGPEVAGLLAGTLPAESGLSRGLRASGAAIVYSRSLDLAESIGRHVARVLTRDPQPAEGHASAWLAEPVRELGGDPCAWPPPLAPDSEAIAAARPWLDRLPPRFLAVHPGSGSPTKNWPAERFGALADRLSTGRPWALVEGPADAHAAGALATHRGAVRLHGLPPPVLGAVLARAGLYVGNDSGVSHLAAAFGAPTLALFGPTDPEVWAPVGDRVAALRSGDRTMAGLTFEAVWSGASRVRC